MKKRQIDKSTPIIGMTKNEIEGVFDEIYLKEEGIILEFNSNTVKLQSLKDGNIYKIKCKELIKTKIKLEKGDKVLFVPFDDPDGEDYAKIISMIDIAQ